MMDYRDHFQKCTEYVKALDEERRKIEIFQRELPLCLDLVTQAIQKHKQQLLGNNSECANGQSDCSEQTICVEGPLFEEFMPIKESCSSAQQKDDVDELNSLDNDKSSSGKKSDWLISAQLWNQSPNPPTTTTTNEDNQNCQPKKVKVVEVKANGGAFKPFKKEMNPNCDNYTGATYVCSTVVEKAAADGGCRAPAAKKNESRKARRCWSPELHKRFLHALQQLGGSHVATPKQIKELMKVDGLTNDEVKSHLQKYRLHTRRSTPAIHSNTSMHAPQFVLVGGIFYSSSTVATTASSTEHATSSGSSMIKSQTVSLESKAV